MQKTLEKYIEIKDEKSKITQRLAVIQLMPEAELTTEVRAEQLTLRQRQPVVEGELQAAFAEQRAEQEKGVTLDTADTELRALTKKANCGDVISATIEQRMTNGATAELQAHYKINSNQIPIEMLRLERGVEQRAAATVPASVGDAVQGEVVVPIFASGDGAFLGIERPIVGVGVAAYPVLGTAPSIKGPFSDSSDAPQTDATFTANSLAPERLQASYAYRSSDAARFSGLDASLRLALNGGLEEALDQQSINGSDGLLNGTNLSNNNVTATTTFALYLSGLLYGRVDGRYARTPADVRILVGQSAFSHSSAVYKDASTDESALERLGSRSGGLRVSPHVPGISSKRQNTLIRLGMERGAAVQPMWQGVTILADPYSRSTQGEIVITAVLLSSFAITRAGQFSKRQIQIP